MDELEREGFFKKLPDQERENEFHAKDRGGRVSCDLKES